MNSWLNPVGALFRTMLAFTQMHFDTGSDAPAPDPLIGQSALKNAEVADKALKFYEGVYQNDIKPRQQKLDDLNAQVTQQQLADQKATSQFANEQRNQYRTLYQPLEEKSVQDATNYDSAANVDRRMGVASANVNQAFSNSREQSIRALQRYGINPNSGAFAALNSRLTTAQALADAGARTGAAFDTMDKGIALRAGAVQTGRGLTNSAAQALAGSTAAGSSAVNGGVAVAGAGTNGVNTAGNGYSTAIQGNNSAGQIMNTAYGNQLQYQASQGNTMASLAGTAAGLYMFSSSKLKDRKQSLDSEPVLERVRGLKVDRWAYKGDNQLHIGPYAEDLHAKFGVGDGVTIGAGDSGGIALAGLKELNDKVDLLAQSMGVQVGNRRTA